MFQCSLYLSSSKTKSVIYHIRILIYTVSSSTELTQEYKLRLLLNKTMKIRINTFSIICILLMFNKNTKMAWTVD